METAGIIAEYNPFHNGHGFLQQQAAQLAFAPQRCSAATSSSGENRRCTPPSSGRKLP